MEKLCSLNREIYKVPIIRVRFASQYGAFGAICSGCLGLADKIVLLSLTRIPEIWRMSWIHNVVQLIQFTQQMHVPMAWVRVLSQPSFFPYPPKLHNQINLHKLVDSESLDHSLCRERRSRVFLLSPSAPGIMPSLFFVSLPNWPVVISFSPAVAMTLLYASPAFYA